MSERALTWIQVVLGLLAFWLTLYWLNGFGVLL